MGQQEEVFGGITRRRVLGLLLSATGASLLAACSQAAPSGAPTAASKPASATTAPAVVGTPPPGGSANIPTPGTAAKPAETPKRGGSLRWGQVGDIVTTDAVLSSPASNETTGEVCDELIA